MGTKKVRKGPSASATAFSVGTKKKGSDGNYWIVVATKANVHKWQKIKNLTNEIQIESTNKNDIVVDLNDQVQDFNENPTSTQENQDDTIVLIEKKPNNPSKKNYNSTHSENLIDQSTKSDSINLENKKVFKFKKNLNSESKNDQIIDSAQSDDYSSSPSSIERETQNIKKFKLKKSLNGSEKYKLSDEQNI